MNPQYGDVSVALNGHVAVLEVDRPPNNHVSAGMMRDLADAFDALDAEPACRALVLATAVKVFCGGADLKAISERGPGQGRANTVREDGELGPMGPTRMRLNKPVIAAVEGYAVAGGPELSLWADLRVAAESAVFGVFCRRFGVPLIDLGTVRLPRLIGQSRAMDLILTGRPVPAREAHEMGLANRVVPDGQALDAALTLARQIAAFPQACMRNDRQSALEQWSLDWDAATANEARLGSAVLASGETLEGATRFASGEGRHGAFQ